MSYNFSSELLSLWGKKAKIGQQYLWLPLMAHLIDTKNVIGYLYTNYLTDSQRKIIDLDLPIIEFLGYIHDLGKISPAFQNEGQDKKDLFNKVATLAKIDLETGKQAHPEQSKHAVIGEYFLMQTGKINFYFSSLIGAHHGTTISKLDLKQQQIYQNNYGLALIWQKMRQEAFNYGYDQLNQTDKEILQCKKLNWQQDLLITGLIIMADWLASDTNLFPLIPVNKDFTDLNFQERFQKGIALWHKNNKWHPQAIDDPNQYFQDHFGFTPRKTQIEMLTELFKIKQPGLTIIEAPMGSGKTETALTLAENFANKTHKTGLYYALPTQSTSNAMLPRLTNWLNHEKGTHNIVLMHGKAQFNQEYQKLKDSQSKIFVDSWYDHKKSILSQFAIGTIDQLLALVLQRKHLALRHLGFSNKVVIIDEIHATDIYMDSYLVKALKWLSAYHVPVIALSATLPLAKRQMLINAYAGKNVKLPETDAYPLLTYTDGLSVKSQTRFSNLPTKSVTIRKVEDDSFGGMAKLAEQLVKDGGVCGIVVNSINRAQAIAKEINVPHLVLHSAFLPIDRANIEARLLHLIGKNGQRLDKFIVIGTQVLEMSLDIDFDVLITDVAAMDALLQRIGRLQRHQIKRPAQFNQAVCYVSGLNNNKVTELAQTIYTPYLIKQTVKNLPDRIVLPNAISKLVQKAYRDAYDSKTSNDLDKINFDKMIQKKQADAKSFQIADLTNEAKAFNRLFPNMLLDSDNQMQCAVRDIGFRIEAVLLHRDGSLLNGNKQYNHNDLLNQTVYLPIKLNQFNNKLLDFDKKRELKLLELDNNNFCQLGDYQIHYSNNLGLEMS